MAWHWWSLLQNLVVKGVVKIRGILAGINCVKRFVNLDLEAEAMKGVFAHRNETTMGLIKSKYKIPLVELTGI